jgi:hypothetical protein
MLKNALDLTKGGHLVRLSCNPLADWALAEWSASGLKEVISFSASGLEIISARDSPLLNIHGFPVII